MNIYQFGSKFFLMIVCVYVFQLITDYVVCLTWETSDTAQYSRYIGLSTFSDLAHFSIMSQVFSEA